MTPPTLSVVIPTLNAAADLNDTLRSLAALSGDDRAGCRLLEIIVADGGSSDGTPAIAAAAGASVVPAPRGRGAQLAAGANRTRGQFVLFLHADTVLRGPWVAAIEAFMRDPDAAQRAALFRLAFRSDDARARRVARLANWRSRALGLPYGDQGLLLAKTFYDALGGYRPWPLMEDVDLVRRIGRRRLVTLDAEAATSARRYESGGWLRRPLRNLVVLGLYFLGVPPRYLVRLYGSSPAR